MYSRALFIILYYISASLSAKVTWLPNKSFNLPFNFMNGELPCSKQTVVFPETLSASIRIESGTSVGGFVLPTEGELVLADGFIELGSNEGDNCTTGYTYYRDKSTSLWTQPDVWSSPRYNKATPDAERVPCFDDIVEFPNNTEFTVVLPNEPQRMQGFIINGVNYNTLSFKNYIMMQSDQTQQFILNENLDTGIEISQDYCRSPAGCSCQNELVQIDCSAKFCPVPSCINPVKPIGHCCKICGGAIAYYIDETFDMTLFKEQVERTVESFGRDNLVYHIGRIRSNIVQLVVVDKNEYTGSSAEVVNEIAYNSEVRLHNMQISGSPLYKSGLGGKIFVSMFFTVVLIMAGLYVYYYKLPEVRLSTIRFPIIARNQSSLFARFDRRTDSVVSLARRDSIRTIGPSEGTAFKNPLYDSKRKSFKESVIDD